MSNENNTPEEELDDDESEGSDEVEENSEEEEEENSNITDGLAKLQQRPSQALLLIKARTLLKLKIETC
jgi:hypothetical protein